MKDIANKFVSWEVPALETLTGSKEYTLRQKLNEKGRLNRDEKNWITQNVNGNCYFKNAIPLHGYRFSFSDVLRIFVVKQYGSYQEYRAIDKTSLRALICGRIERIIELKETE
jgi:hypothetical protein